MNCTRGAGQAAENFILIVTAFQNALNLLVPWSTTRTVPNLRVELLKLPITKLVLVIQHQVHHHGEQLKTWASLPALTQGPTEGGKK